MYSNSTDYGFVPLLPLGGIENVEHLDRVKIREHALLTYRLIGKLDCNIDFGEVNYNNGPVNYEVLKPYT
ncbi:T6SS immunity protein Tdi1 domain-containing protein [Candidatus Enterococcus palustris]|uniref:T6SS immunity protein Tdi1 domain-containing protein n=1 Tax=Candidatus Enterococcus palustris TaxID=1834189 RepID=UPI001BAFF6FD